MPRVKSKAPEAPVVEVAEQRSEAIVAESAAAMPEPAPVSATGKKKTVKARVLAACSYGQPNSVIEIDVELATTLAGVVDTDPEAVAYAESIQRQ